MSSLEVSELDFEKYGPYNTGDLNTVVSAGFMS
jgi:hypothetical protein